METKEKFILQLDSSQLEQYMICPLSWYYKYFENIRLGTAVRKKAPDMGTIEHKLLEHFYTALGEGKSRYAAANIAQSKLIEEDAFTKLNLREEAVFLKKRFMQYVMHYDERDFNFVKSSTGEVGTEVGFAKTLYENEECLYIVTGRFDGLVETGSGTAWVDHKTQGREMDLYPFNPQFLTYAWATGLEWGIINYIRMHQEYDKNKTFKKQPIMFPKHLVKSWEVKMLRIFREIHDKFLDPILLQARFYYDRNEESCAGAFKSKPCQFCQLCEIDPVDKNRIAQVKASNYQVVPKWEPWKLEEENGD